MAEIKIPDYEKLKNLPLFYIDDNLFEDENKVPYEYKFYLFDIFENIYCRLVYNEEGSGLLFLDVMSDGYCDRFNDSNLRFKFDESGYKLMCKKVNEIYNKVMSNVLKSNEKYSKEWF